MIRMVSSKRDALHPVSSFVCYMMNRPEHPVKRHYGLATKDSSSFIFSTVWILGSYRINMEVRRNWTMCIHYSPSVGQPQLGTVYSAIPIFFKNILPNMVILGGYVFTLPELSYSGILVFLLILSFLSINFNLIKCS